MRTQIIGKIQPKFYLVFLPRTSYYFIYLPRTFYHASTQLEPGGGGKDAARFDEVPGALEHGRPRVGRKFARQGTCGLTLEL